MKGGGVYSSGSMWSPIRLAPGDRGTSQGDSISCEGSQAVGRRCGIVVGGFPGGSAVKNQPAMQEMQEPWVQSMQEMQETWVQPLGRIDPLEEGVATQTSILAWRIPWTEDPGGLRSIGSQRVCTTERLNTGTQWGRDPVIPGAFP